MGMQSYQESVSTNAPSRSERDVRARLHRALGDCVTLLTGARAEDVADLEFLQTLLAAKKSAEGQGMPASLLSTLQSAGLHFRAELHCHEK